MSDSCSLIRASCYYVHKGCGTTIALWLWIYVLRIVKNHKERVFHLYTFSDKPFASLGEGALGKNWFWHQGTQFELGYSVLPPFFPLSTCKGSACRCLTQASESQLSVNDLSSPLPSLERKPAACHFGKVVTSLALCRCTHSCKTEKGWGLPWPEMDIRNSVLF